MTAAIPDDILVAAENALDQLLCNCKEAGDVRQDSIEDIARAILAERNMATEAERERIRAEVQKWKRRDHLSLHAGEVTAQEFRTVVAVLIAIEGVIRNQSPAGE